MRKVANLKYMTNSLQELIDASIFISTEYQARVAELVGAAQWDVDFTAQSLSFETTPPVSLRPYLLGTESENRGTWVWSWQQLGYFPDAVVSAAVQAREAGEKKSLTELSTDEIPLSDSLARRLTLASKTVTGLYAHYPLPAGAGVRAWTLLDGDELVDARRILTRDHDLVSAVDQESHDVAVIDLDLLLLLLLWSHRRQTPLQPLISIH